MCNCDELLARAERAEGACNALTADLAACREIVKAGDAMRAVLFDDDFDVTVAADYDAARQLLAEGKA